MPNKFFVVAVHFADGIGNGNLTIRADTQPSADLVIAQAVAAFAPDHAGWTPIAVTVMEIPLSVLERAVVMVRDIPLEEPAPPAPKRRGRRPRLPPGWTTAGQDASNVGVWGKLNSEEIPPGDSVILPSVKAGASVLVENKGKTPVSVYPGRLRPDSDDAA